MARLPYLEPEQMPEKTQRLLGTIEPKLNVFKIVAHAENSIRHFIRLGSSLLTQTKLDGNLRELAILRVASLSNSNYEWTQHKIIATGIGMSEEKIEGVRTGPEKGPFNELERLVLKFTDEVTTRIKASRATFDAISKYLDHREIVELTLVIGYWSMVARLLESIEVELEGENPP